MAKGLGKSNNEMRGTPVHGKREEIGGVVLDESPWNRARVQHSDGFLLDELLE